MSRGVTAVVLVVLLTAAVYILIWTLSSRWVIAQAQAIVREEA